MSDITITRTDEQHRYEARLDDKAAGVAEFQLTPELVIFTHTEVDPAFEGRGVGSALAKYALDDVRAQGTRRVLVVCPFINAYIARHPEYADLLFNAPRSNATD